MHALVAALILSLSVASSSPSLRSGAVETWQIVASESDVTINVGRTGLFSFAGHEHRIKASAVSGEVDFDRARPEQLSIVMTFAAASLTVDPEGEPPDDVAEVQATMLGPQVLDVEQFPTIVFRSTQVTVGQAEVDAVEFQITGDLTLHGVTRAVTAPATISISSGSLRGVATIKIKQSDFGMKPVSAGLGTVRVKDEIEIELSLVARP